MLITFLPIQGFLKVWSKDCLNQNPLRYMAENENYGLYSRLLNLFLENGASEFRYLSNYIGKLLCTLKFENVSSELKRYTT